MKKILSFILILFVALLAGCNALSPEQTDAQMATEVAQMLTGMPTSEDSVSAKATAGAEAEATLLVGGGPPPESYTRTPTPTNTSTPTVTPTVPTSTPTQTATALPTETNTPAPTFTPTITLAPGDPRLSLGPPTSYDLMDGSNTWVWPTGSDLFTSGEFKDGKFVMTNVNEDRENGWRLGIVEGATHMYTEMTVTTGDVCAGKDNYGIIFRVPIRTEAVRGYVFTVSCDGHYRLWEWDGRADNFKGKYETLISWTFTGAINPGPGQTNRVGVMLQDDLMQLYINGVLMDQKRDDTFKGGFFGISVDPGFDTATADFTIYVDDMSYWQIPR